MLKMNRRVMFTTMLTLSALVVMAFGTVRVVAQDIPTLIYYFVAFSFKPEDMAEVQNAVNEILIPEIGAQIELRPLTFTDAPTKGQLILNSGDDCDVMSFSQFNPFNNAVATGGLAPIGDLLNEFAPTTVANLPADAFNAVTSGGQIYGAPVFQGGVSKAAFWVRGDLTDKYNFDWQAATNLDDWETFFDAVLEGEGGDVIPLISSDPFWGRQWFPAYYGYDPISESIGAPGSRGLVGVKIDDPNLQVVAVPFTPEYREAVERAREWYNKGYFLQTPPQDSEMIALRAQNRFAGFQVPFGGNWSTKGMAANEWDGKVIHTAFYQEKMLITTGNILGSVYGVCAVSEHPTEAVKFIEEMNTNVDLLNLFNFGIEGKHWVWVDEANKVIGFPEGVDANSVGWNPNTYWQFGDRRLVYLTTPDDIGVADRDAADLANANISPLLGFVPDVAPIQNELAQLATVAKQYCDPLDKGLVDVDPALAECQSQITAAGIDTIIAELQAQIDAWKAAQ
jgi:putative aldouronate transport system substrate-binding protein